MHTLLMPNLGDWVDEGKVLRWLKREGEQIKEGEPLLEMETDKINVEVPATASGILRKILASEGELVPVGACLACIGEPDEPLPDLAMFQPSASMRQTPSVDECRSLLSLKLFLRGFLFVAALIIALLLALGQGWLALAAMSISAALFGVLATFGQRMLKGKSRTLDADRQDHLKENASWTAPSAEANRE